MEKFKSSNSQEKDRILLIFFSNTLKQIPGSIPRTIDRKIHDPTARFDPEIVFKFVLFLICWIFFASNEIVKLTCRKNIGKGELSYLRVVLSGLLLASIPVIFWACPYEIVHYSFFPTPNWVVSLYSGLYFYFAYEIIERGRREIENSINTNPDYPGTSTLFAKKVNNGVQKSTVRNWHEPSLFLFVGLILAILNPFLGFPLAAIAIGYWITLLYEYYNNYEHDRMLNENTPFLKENLNGGQQPFVS